MQNIQYGGDKLKITPISPTSKQKENLILVHSFPGNSILLSGLIEYLSDHVNVYFIDLPGFIKVVPALTEISIAGYVQYITEKIEAFELENYWLGGISFGFFLISYVGHDPRCRGFLAVAPYVGLNSLRMGVIKRFFYHIFCKTITLFNLSAFLWTNPTTRKYLPKLKPYPAEHIDMLFDQLDGRTFFETVTTIFETKDEASFKNLPYILVTNQDDQTLDYHYILRTFTNNINLLLIIHTTIDHFPPELTKSYFRAQLPEAVVNKIRNFMSDVVTVDKAAIYLKAIN